MSHDEHAHHGHDHHHHEMPTEGRALTGTAISATLHCLTGCAIGEVAGMAIGTALGFSNGATILLAVTLAFLFGYSLTSLPLLRSGLALGAVIPIALASDTLSIATMEIVDNLVMVVIPGAMHAGLDTLLFWGSLSFALVIAGACAVPVNRYLIKRGKGHAVVHETGIHGGPSPRTVGAVAAVAFVFGTSVLIAEVIDDDDSAGHGGTMAAAGPEHGGHGGEGSGGESHGSAGTMTLDIATGTFTPGKASELTFQVEDEEGEAVREFDVKHTKRMHLIVVRDDLTGFQHLHPEIDASGNWTTPIDLPEPGSYRVYADFGHEGEDIVLDGGVTAEGEAAPVPLPAAADSAATGDGYDVAISGDSAAGEESELKFAVTRGGQAVEVEPYLGAGGHLVAIREGDLEYLHTHPEEGAAHAHGDPSAEPAPHGPVTFATEFPTAGAYRLFFQFKHAGKVHTAEFTREVSE